MTFDPSSVTKLLGAAAAIPALTVPSVLFSQPQRWPPPAARTLPEGTDPGCYAGGRLPGSRDRRDERFGDIASFRGSPSAIARQRSYRPRLHCSAGHATAATLAACFGSADREGFSGRERQSHSCLSREMPFFLFTPLRHAWRVIWMAAFWTHRTVLDYETEIVCCAPPESGSVGRYPRLPP